MTSVWVPAKSGWLLWSSPFNYPRMWFQDCKRDLAKCLPPFHLQQEQRSQLPSTAPSLSSPGCLHWGSSLVWRVETEAFVQLTAMFFGHHGETWENLGLFQASAALQQRQRWTMVSLHSGHWGARTSQHRLETKVLGVGDAPGDYFLRDTDATWKKKIPIVSQKKGLWRNVNGFQGTSLPTSLQHWVFPISTWNTCSLRASL